MSMIRTVHNRENPYVLLNKKALWDSQLSLEAAGLWARLLSRPDDWRVSVLELAKSCKCGKDKIYRLLKELIKAGYAYRCQLLVPHGKKKVFGSYDTYVFEYKVTPEEIQKMFPQRAFPLAEPVVTGKDDATNTDLTNPSSLRSEVKETKECPSSAKAEPSADADHLCNFFLESIKKRCPDLKPPNLTKWRSCMDLLLRVDKRDLEKTKRLIIWSEDHKHWRSACLSPEKLRRVYDDMSIQMDSEAKNRLVQTNRTYAIKLKEKYPKELAGFTFDDKFAINRTLSKEISFSMDQEAFKAAFVSLFGGENGRR